MNRQEWQARYGVDDTDMQRIGETIKTFRGDITAILDRPAGTGMFCLRNGVWKFEN